jgi:hypothetical protein
MQTTAALIVVAYFFLLRVGEYTPSTDRKRKKRTIPLRKKDVKLFRNGLMLSPESDLAVLLAADSASINLENQKNGQKNATLSHSSTDDPEFDPTSSLAYLLFALRGKSPDMPIGNFLDEQGNTRSVSAKEIRTAVRIGAAADNLEDSGYDLSRIGSHSLRVGGAVRLKIAGYDSDMIKKLGRWSSDTYLRYIQSQIVQLTVGVAANMARLLRFTNVVA